MATFRRRKNKWQAIVRHKDIGVVAKTFQSKTQAVKWAFRRDMSGLFDKVVQSEFKSNPWPIATSATSRK